MNNNFLNQFYKKNNLNVPTLHVVLGSGLVAAAKAPEGWEKVAELEFGDIPGFSTSTVKGHLGKFIYFKNKDSKTFCLQAGRLHGYEGHEPKDAVKPVTLACDAGTKNFILSNAAGSLDKSYKPGDLMIIEDHFNFTGKNPLIGLEEKNESGENVGPRFPDMTEAYSSEINSALKAHFESEKINTHSGVYVGVMGPSFETKAEVRHFSNSGFGAVGMSTVWENISLNHRGARVGGFSFISNFGTGLVSSTDAPTHDEVIELGEEVSPKVIRALFKIAEQI